MKKIKLKIQIKEGDLLDNMVFAVDKSNDKKEGDLLGNLGFIRT